MHSHYKVWGNNRCFSEIRTHIATNKRKKERTYGRELGKRVRDVERKDERNDRWKEKGGIRTLYIPYFLVPFRCLLAYFSHCVIGFWCSKGVSIVTAPFWTNNVPLCSNQAPGCPGLCWLQVIGGWKLRGSISPCSLARSWIICKRWL